MPSCVIALDVGGTAMKGALIGRAGGVLAEVRRPTTGAGGAMVVEAIGAAAAELAALAENSGLAVSGAGVVVPGIVDEAAGRAVYSANLGWRELPLAEILVGRLGMAVALGHDVRAGARAEAAMGAARGIRDVVFVPIGTGIAGAVICDGRVVSGGGYAGEIGHLVVRPGGAACRCGGRGCLETVASAAAIAARFTARSGLPAAGASDVVRRLDQGDRAAREVWDEAVAALADALAATAAVVAPELVVVGGGLAEAGDRLLVPLGARLAERLTYHRRPRLVRAALGDRAGCLGAGLLAWERVGVGGDSDVRVGIEAAVHGSAREAES